MPVLENCAQLRRVNNNSSRRTWRFFFVLGEYISYWLSLSGSFTPGPSSPTSKHTLPSDGITRSDTVNLHYVPGESILENHLEVSMLEQCLGRASWRKKLRKRKKKSLRKSQEIENGISIFFMLNFWNLAACALKNKLTFRIEIPTKDDIWISQKKNFFFYLLCSPNKLQELSWFSINLKTLQSNKDLMF